jgi:hypothetical protein
LYHAIVLRLHRHYLPLEGNHTQSDLDLVRKKSLFQLSIYFYLSLSVGKMAGLGYLIGRLGFLAVTGPQQVAAKPTNPARGIWTWFSGIQTMLQQLAPFSSSPSMFKVVARR